MAAGAGLSGSGVWVRAAGARGSLGVRWWTGIPKIPKMKVENPSFDLGTSPMLRGHSTN